MSVLRLALLAVPALALAAPRGPEVVRAQGGEALPAGALARLRTVPAGERAPKYPDHAACVAFVAFSPDGKNLFSANRHEGVRYWELARGKELARWRDRGAELWAAALAPDGRTLVWGPGHNRRLYAWEPSRSQRVSEVRVAEVRGPEDHSKALAFSPDGKLVASASSRYDDGIVRVWDWPTARPRQRFDLRLSDVMALAFSPDGSVLACGATGGVRLWDLKTGRVLHTFDQYACALAFSPDGKLLAVSHGNEGAVTLWDVGRGAVVLRLTPLITDGRYGAATALAFTADGRVLAAGGFDNCLRLWDVAAGKERCVFRGQAGPIMSLAFSPDARKLAAGDGASSIMLWDVWGLSMPAAVDLARGGPAAVWRALAREAFDPWQTPLAVQRRKVELRTLPRTDLIEAHHAVGLLVAAPEKAVPWLREWLRPATPERLQRLLGDLDSPQFAVRVRAARELEHYGQTVLPTLRRHLKDPLSLEVRRRTEQLVERLEKAPPFSLARGTARAVEALENINSVPARQLLASLAREAPDAANRQEAAAALQRLRRRPGMTGRP